MVNKKKFYLGIDAQDVVKNSYIPGAMANMYVAVVYLIIGYVFCNINFSTHFGLITELAKMIVISAAGLAVVNLMIVLQQMILICLNVGRRELSVFGCFKKLINPTGGNICKTGGTGRHNKGFLDFTTENMEIKYLPHKNLNSKTLENDMDVQKIYYGRCALYIVKYVLELKYYIDSDYTYNYSKDNKQNYTSAITNAYVDYAANGLSQKEIWKDVNTKAEVKYLAELVSATVDSDNTFSVLVKYTDEKSLKSVSEAIQKELKGRYEDIADRIGSHKLVLVSENYQVQTDSDLANSQSTVASLIKSYRDQISTLTSAMTEEQLKVVDSELAEERENETTDETVAPEKVEVTAPTFSKKYVVLGFVMGIFLAALYLVCVAVLSNKLQEAEELVRFYKLRQFGILTQNKGSKGINGFLLRIKYRNQKLGM